jgi:FkbM family methyltransferase
MNGKIIFDVGANDGYSCLHHCVDINNRVYAFEPTPQLVTNLRQRTTHLPNYILTEAAVSDYNGTATFNIAGNADWGCSSLLPLSERAKTEWGGRTDMFVTETVEVQVIRLDSFIEQHNIPHIDFLHIDTQGSDLTVLQGLGQYISIVKEGVMEAAIKQDVLYVNQNTVEDSVNFLAGQGFTILNVYANDGHNNEANIHFIRT